MASHLHKPPSSDPTAPGRVLHALGEGRPSPKPFPGVWRALDRQAAGGQPVAFSTGFEALDAALPGAGWPTGLTEILSIQPGLSEAGLLVPTLVPALASVPDAGPPIRHRAPPSWWAWVVPERWPWVPHAPGWQGLGLDLHRLLWVRPSTVADATWSIEQMLREVAVLGVVWVAPQVTPLQLRRVHWAARSVGRPVFVARPASAAVDASPAPLRLFLRPLAAQALEVEVLKCPGPRPPAPLILTHPARPHLHRDPSRSVVPTPTQPSRIHVVDRSAPAEASA